MQDKIQLLPYNSAFSKISAEEGILREIAEHFTFYAENYWFSPKFKNKVWDGKIRILKRDKIYSGLKSKVEDFAKSRNYQFEDLTNELETELSLIEGEDFVSSLNVHLPENGKPRDFQIKAFVEAIRRTRGIILSPTASGKSLILYFITRFLLRKGYKGVLIVPSTALVEQMYSDFDEYSKNNGWNIEENCNRIYASYGKDKSKPLTISTWQSLYNLPNEFFSDFDFVLGDESHEWKANSLISIMSMLENTKYRIGTTGTLDGIKINSLVLEGLFGDTIQTSKTSELIEKKILSQFRIKNLILKYPESISKNFNKKVTYDQEIKYINSSNIRNRFIKNLALSLEGNTLILFRYVEKHGKILHEILKDSGKNVYFLSGKTETEEREEIRKILEKEENAILIASSGTFSRGSNVRRLHNIIMAFPSKGKIKLLQSIGRILRPSKDKEIATLYDIIDDFRHGKYVNYALKHFEIRYKIYLEEKFQTKNYRIELHGN